MNSEAVWRIEGSVDPPCASPPFNDAHPRKANAMNKAVAAVHIDNELDSGAKASPARAPAGTAVRARSRPPRCRRRPGSEESPRSRAARRPRSPCFVRRRVPAQSPGSKAVACRARYVRRGSPSVSRCRSSETSVVDTACSCSRPAPMCCASCRRSALPMLNSTRAWTGSRLRCR